MEWLSRLEKYHRTSLGQEWPGGHIITARPASWKSLSAAVDDQGEQVTNCASQDHEAQRRLLRVRTKGLAALSVQALCVRIALTGTVERIARELPRLPSSVAQRVLSLPVQVLSRALQLSHLAFGLGLLIAGQISSRTFDLAAEFLRGTCIRSSSMAFLLSVRAGWISSGQQRTSSAIRLDGRTTQSAAQRNCKGRLRFLLVESAPE